MNFLCWIDVVNLFQQSFELQPLMSQQQQQQQQLQLASTQLQISAPLHQRRQRSSNSHSETFRERFGSCQETPISPSHQHNFEHDEFFNSSNPTSPR